MSDKYFYRPLGYYGGMVLKCAGICDDSNIDKANELFIERKDPVYLPGFVILDSYMGDKVTVDRSNNYKEFNYGDKPVGTKRAMPTILRKGCYRNNIDDENGIEVARIGLFALNDDSDPTIEAFRDEIVDRYNADPLVVKVEVIKVYGNDMIYPKNSAGERFAAISGKKTFTGQDLANIRALGFVIEEVAGKKLAA